MLAARRYVYASAYLLFHDVGMHRVAAVLFDRTVSGEVCPPPCSLNFQRTLPTMHIRNLTTNKFSLIFNDNLNH